MTAFVSFKKINLLLVGLVLLSASWLWLSAPAAASYHSNRLIDNYPFLNANAMNQLQIQSFLTSKNSYLATHKFKEDCSSSPTYMGSHYAHCGQTVLVSYLIDDAAKAYGISPRTIMATLQKEQSLITDPSPSSSQLNFAMGYDCPDSGSCTLSGFFNQLDSGTWQLRLNYARASGDNTWSGWDFAPATYACPSRTNYYSTGLYPGRSVTFYDDHGTAYQTFTLANAATAALYCYTPHAYPGSTREFYSGSYNFVTSYEAWWGSTYANPIKLTYIAGHSSESGATAVVEYSLVSQPSANVIIPMQLSDATEASFSSSSSVTATNLTITPTNWNQPSNNKVTIYGVDDHISDGDIAYSLIAGTPSSTDDTYGSLASTDTPNAALINNDNEPDRNAVGDWNGSGQQTISLQRGDQFLLNNAFDSRADSSFAYGLYTDEAIAGDWNGNRQQTIGLFRPTTGQFFLANRNRDHSDITFSYGTNGDIPLAGDWNGDGKWTVGLYRPSTRMFYLSDRLDGRTSVKFTFGRPGDVPLAGDWNGDGKWTVGLYRPSTRMFYLDDADNGKRADFAFSYGRVGDTPIVGNWSKDGKTYVGLRRGNEYFLTYSDRPKTAVDFRYGR